MIHVFFFFLNSNASQLYYTAVHIQYSIVKGVTFHFIFSLNPSDLLSQSIYSEDDGKWMPSKSFHMRMDSGRTGMENEIWVHIEIVFGPKIILFALDTLKLHDQLEFSQRKYHENRLTDNIQQIVSMH